MTSYPLEQDAPAPPPGHRRNRPLSAWRKATAVELATQGRTYEQIAAEVGCANRGTANRAVKQALDSRTVAAVKNYREVELSRLDAMQTSL